MREYYSFKTRNQRDQQADLVLFQDPTKYKGSQQFVYHVTKPSSRNRWWKKQVILSEMNVADAKRRRNSMPPIMPNKMPRLRLRLLSPKFGHLISFLSDYRHNNTTSDNYEAFVVLS